ncbi:hypothetical protein [Prauserella cavernicola]|uniref:EthD domain-containing protein n=1 Tax=Prauserella cavernicola TaxID=2800127 RepID=A0A934QZU5_9PSEU|nr:hypothetical protein [Prauserella cavernicola]MBK1789441.1 hypothetical protein [Prauserella cavernicola]
MSATSPSEPAEQPAELMLVFARARHERRRELSTWYDENHIPEVLERFPQIESVRRYDLDSTVAHGPAEGVPLIGPQAHSLAVYRVRGSARDLWASITNCAELGTSPDFDYRSVFPVFTTV